MVEQRGSAGDDQPCLRVIAAGDGEGFQDADGVLARFHPADGEEDRSIAGEREPRAQFGIRLVRQAGETGKVDAVTDNGGAAVQLRRQPVAPQRAHHEQLVGFGDGGALHRRECGIGKAIDVMDGAGEAGDAALTLQRGQRVA